MKILSLLVVYFGLLVSSILAGDCNNPLLALFNISKLDAPTNVTDLKYCKSLQSGQSCCSAETVNGFQAKANDLAEKLKAIVASRDRQLVEARDTVLPQLKASLQDLRNNSQQALTVLKAKMPLAQNGSNNTNGSQPLPQGQGSNNTNGSQPLPPQGQNPNNTNGTNGTNSSQPLPPPQGQGSNNTNGSQPLPPQGQGANNTNGTNSSQPLPPPQGGSNNTNGSQPLPPPQGQQPQNNTNGTNSSQPLPPPQGGSNNTNGSQPLPPPQGQQPQNNTNGTNSSQPLPPPQGGSNNTNGTNSSQPLPPPQGQQPQNNTNGTNSSQPLPPPQGGSNNTNGSQPLPPQGQNPNNTNGTNNTNGSQPLPPQGQGANNTNGSQPLPPQGSNNTNGSQPNPPPAPINSSSPGFAAASSLVESLGKLSQQVVDGLPEIKGNFSNFQKSRSTCVVEMVKLQAAAWCLSCDPNYASKGVSGSNSLQLSNNVCGRLQTSCFDFISQSSQQSTLLSIKQLAPKIGMMATGLQMIISDNSTGLTALTNAIAGTDNNATAAPPVEMPPNCTSVGQCPWICTGLFNNGQVNQTLVAAGGAIGDGTTNVTASGSRLLAEVEEGTAVERKLNKRRVLAASEWNPDQDEAGVQVTFAADPANVNPTTSDNGSYGTRLVGMSLTAVFAVLALLFI